MIWLVGYKGMLGREIKTLLTETKADFLASDIEISILDYPGILEFTKGKDIKWIINCAAYTAVDKAEEEEEFASQLNGEGPKNLALFCRENGAKLIHISTDYVFNGQVDKALCETDTTDPIGAYGRSKLLGEQRIKATLEEFFIIRTAWLYGNSGPSFVHTMLKLMENKHELKVVNDQFGSPTYTFDLAKAILQFIETNSTSYGIYHFSNEGRTNWYEFALEIQKKGLLENLLSNECSIYPVDSSAYHTKAKRPAFSLLDKTKIKTELELQIPNWEQSLTKFLSEDFKKWNET